jgi:hypothetical protein
MTNETMRQLAQEVARVIHRELEPVRLRLTALEARPELKHEGTYQEGTEYRAGSFVTRRGGIWLAERATAAKPGSEGSGWRLVVKEGHA